MMLDKENFKILPCGIRTFKECKDHCSEDYISLCDVTQVSQYNRQSGGKELMKKYDFKLPIDPDDPPKEIKNWIIRLKKCFNDAPPGLWFTAGTGGLTILATDKDGKRIFMLGESGDGIDRIDQDSIIDTVGSKLDIDGGDPW